MDRRSIYVLHPITYIREYINWESGEGRSTGEVERRKSRERLEDYSRGDKVFYNVEERSAL